MSPRRLFGLCFLILALFGFCARPAHAEIIGTPGPGVNKYPRGGMAIDSSRLLGPGGILAIAVNDAGTRAYVVVWSRASYTHVESRLLEIDLAGGMILREQELDHGCTEILLDEPGNSVLILVGDGSVRRVSLGTLLEDGRIDCTTGADPFFGTSLASMLADSQARRLYLSTSQPTQIIEYDLDDFVELRRGPASHPFPETLRLGTPVLGSGNKVAYCYAHFQYLTVYQSFGWASVNLETLTASQFLMSSGWSPLSRRFEVGPKGEVGYVNFSYHAPDGGRIGTIRLSDFQLIAQVPWAADGDVVLNSSGTRAHLASPDGCISTLVVPSFSAEARTCLPGAWSGFRIISRIAGDRLLCTGYQAGNRLVVVSNTPSVQVENSIALDEGWRGTALLLFDPSRDLLFEVSTGLPTVVSREALSWNGSIQNSWLRLPGSMSRISAGVLHPSANSLLLGTDEVPARIVEVTGGPDSLEITREITLDEGEDHAFCAAIDEAGGFAYFGMLTSPGRIVKVRLNPLERVDAVTLAPGEDFPRALFVDRDTGTLLAGLFTSPGRVVRLDADSLARLDAIELPAGDSDITCGAWDEARRLAVFGTATAPARAIVVDASSFTHVGTIEMGPGEDFLRSMASSGVTGDVYGVLGTIPPRVVRIDPDKRERIGAIPLPAGTYADAIAADHRSGAVRVASEEVPGGYASEFTLRTGLDGQIRGSAIYIPSEGSIGNIRFHSHIADGELAFAIYDASLALLWQSGPVENDVEGGYIVCPVLDEDGIPIHVQPGPIYIAWQTDSHRRVAGWAPASGNSCFSYSAAFPSAPEGLTTDGYGMEWNSNNYAISVEYTPSNVVSAAANWSLYD